MYTLGIETSSDIGSVALVSDNDVIEVESFGEAATHARDILPGIDRLLRNCGVEKKQVRLVAVSIGPGSFTGLRVGVTCAKTLAYTLGWEAAAVCSLEAMAYGIKTSEISGNYLCPVRDARRGAVCGRIFKKQRRRWSAETDVIIDSPKRLAERLPPGATVSGTGAEAYSELFERSGFCLAECKVEEIRNRAGAVAMLGLRHAEEGNTITPMKLLPKYYRLTEVEERLGGRGD